MKLSVLYSKHFVIRFSLIFQKKLVVGGQQKRAFFSMFVDVICKAGPFDLFDCFPENPGQERLFCSQICDTYPQCGNEYDESNCEFFTCTDGVQLPFFMQCNWVEECPDGSDETEGCNSIGPNFVCKDGTQLPRYAACDGYYDCVG